MCTHIVDFQKKKLVTMKGNLKDFERMIRAAGFANTKVEPIMGGLVAIHSGWKI